MISVLFPMVCELQKWRQQQQQQRQQQQQQTRYSVDFKIGKQVIEP